MFTPKFGEKNRFGGKSSTLVGEMLASRNGLPYWVQYILGLWLYVVL